MIRKVFSYIISQARTGVTALLGGTESYRILNDDAESLVVLLHGWSESPRSYDQVIKTLRSTDPKADIYAPLLPLTLFSTTNLEHLARDLVEDVQDFIDKRSPQATYKKITVVGHSCGGITTRLLLLDGLGVVAENGGVSIAKKPRRPWISKIDRLVLLGAVNRGWTITSATHPLLRFIAPLLIGIGNILCLIDRPAVFQIRRGAAVITSMRLRWLALQRSGASLPPVIQVLGTVDDIVAPEDNIDLTTGSDFIYLEAAKSGHFNVLDTLHEIHGAQRAKVLMDAIRKDIPALQDVSEKKLLHIKVGSFNSEVATGLISNRDADSEADPDVACFIIHGIRDNGFWTRKIANTACDLAEKAGKTCAAYTPSYGFFPLLSFALPWTRQAKVEWFMDLYVDVVSKHPNSELVYLGHSNGTYLLAKALTECPAIRFDRVLFAGSVVRRDYDWITRQHQAKKVVNLVATSDWVVAAFPSAFDRLKIQDLGSAGHSGFTHLIDLEDERVVDGQHGAGIDEDLWGELANFVVNGESLRSDLTMPRELGLTKQSRLAQILYFLSPAWWVIGIAVVAVVSFWITVTWPDAKGLSHMQVAAAFTLFLLVIARVLTRF